MFTGVPTMWDFASVMTLVTVIELLGVVALTMPQGATLVEIHTSEPSLPRQWSASNVPAGVVTDSVPTCSAPSRKSAFGGVGAAPPLLPAMAMMVLPDISIGPRPPA